jgi:hypothetical protein
MWLSADEQIILQYLKCCGEVGASGREICRKSSTKDRWKEDERWAFPFITALKDKKLIENTPAGNYRLVPEDDEDEEEEKRRRKP